MSTGHLAGGAVLVAARLILLLGLMLITSANRPATASETGDIHCLALTIYHEARGESHLGKLAVGHVVMNRTRSAAFPDDVCDVVKQGGERRHRCQFSWWCDGRSDRPRDAVALLRSLSLARDIYHGCTIDPTAGALWFHARSVNPSWSKAFRPGRRIGQHVFYRGNPRALASRERAYDAAGRGPAARPVAANGPARGTVSHCRSRMTPPGRA
jgi:hypothetical protein